MAAPCQYGRYALQAPGVPAVPAAVGFYDHVAGPGSCPHCRLTCGDPAHGAGSPHCNRCLSRGLQAMVGGRAATGLPIPATAIGQHLAAVNNAPNDAVIRLSTPVKALGIYMAASPALAALLHHHPAMSLRRLTELTGWMVTTADTSEAERAALAHEYNVPLAALADSPPVGAAQLARDLYMLPEADYMRVPVPALLAQAPPVVAVPAAPAVPAAIAPPAAPAAIAPANAAAPVAQVDFPAVPAVAQVAPVPPLVPDDVRALLASHHVGQPGVTRLTDNLTEVAASVDPAVLQELFQRAGVPLTVDTVNKFIQANQTFLFLGLRGTDMPLLLLPPLATSASAAGPAVLLPDTRAWLIVVTVTPADHPVFPFARACSMLHNDALEPPGAAGVLAAGAVAILSGALDPGLDPVDLLHPYVATPAILNGHLPGARAAYDRVKAARDLLRNGSGPSTRSAAAAKRTLDDVNSGLSSLATSAPCPLYNTGSCTNNSVAHADSHICAYHFGAHGGSRLPHSSKECRQYMDHNNRPKRRPAKGKGPKPAAPKGQAQQEQAASAKQGN